MLRSASRRLSSLYDRALAPIGINVAQYSLLRMIEHRQPISLTELARRAELDRSTIGRNVIVLERLGFVATRRSEDDQRGVMVNLADRGEAVLSRAAPLWQDCQHAIEAKLGAVNVAALQEILRRI